MSSELELLPALDWIDCLALVLAVVLVTLVCYIFAKAYFFEFEGDLLNCWLRLGLVATEPGIVWKFEM